MAFNSPVVAITHNPKDISASISEALERLELSGLIEGYTVAIKPNETFASESDRTGVTQPETLDAVLETLGKLGPSKTVVSGGAGAAETHEVFEIMGLDRVVERHGAEFFDHNRAPFVEVELGRSGRDGTASPQKSVMVNPRVLEYETLVSLAQLKVHSTATVTLSLKNIAMSYPAADHYGHPRSNQDNEHAFFDDMHGFIVQMAARFPIDLAIIVGHPAMVGKGPLGGHTANTGLVIASRDPVAADVVGAHLLGFEVQGVRHLWQAGDLGLGQTSLDQMEFPGLDPGEAKKIFDEAVFAE